MIKNRAAKAFIIAACLTVSTAASVYADTSSYEVKPAIVEPANDESQLMTIQITAAKNEDELAKKQQEIDQYVFDQHRQEMEEKGIMVTHTGVVGDAVEVGIAPYSQENADYLYELFGKEQVKIVEGQQAVPLDLVTATAGDETSFFEAIINSIVSWFKNLF